MKFFKKIFLIIVTFLVTISLSTLFIGCPPKPTEEIIEKTIEEVTTTEEAELKTEEEAEETTREITEETTEETIEETTEEVKEEIRKYTILSGIENDELVVPEINLWSDYGENRIAKGAKVVGIVKHNTEVQILEEAVDGKTKFYKVKSPDNLIGWVSENFVTDIIEK